uniref:VWFA domain-containing protein n=1 Tax=Arcella intermedia TaxID=1963864 RepID=A0A6B2L4T6_9EUKA
MQRTSRASIDIVAVIDRSESMVDRMDLVKDTIQFMIKQLKPGDHLGLIVYDQSVDVVFPLLEMDTQGKHRALLEMKNLKIGGQTNTSAGLLQALELIRKRKKDGQEGVNDVSTVLLFTDGLANLGLTKTAQIKKAVSGVLSQIDEVCSIFTFGYGKEPDPEYLKEIATEGNGMYYHIDKPEAIPLAFSDCLGGLLSVVAQQIVVSIEVPKGVLLVDTKTSFKKTILSETLTKVMIDDLYSEEEKDILCTLDIPAVQSAVENFSVIDVDVTYTNVIHNKQGYDRTGAIINRTSSPSPCPKPVNPAIDRQMNRLICADAMQQALDAGQRLDFNTATRILSTAEHTILTSPTADDSYCVGLVRQLQQGKSEVSNQLQFQTTGQPSLSSRVQSHYQQRGTYSFGITTYSTSAKSRMTEGYQQYKTNT